MSEKDFNLEELSELKTTYRLVEEELDGKEIVNEEQIRQTLYRKFANLRANAKDSLLWINLLAVPVFILTNWSRTTPIANWLLVGYWVASVLFKMFLLRKTRRKEYGSYDLKTLIEKEARYQKNNRIAVFTTLAIWAAWLLTVVLSYGKTGALFVLGMIAVVSISVLIRKLIVKYKFNGEAIDPQTGKPNILKVKGIRIFLFSILAISLFCFLADFVTKAIECNTLVSMLDNLAVVPLLVSIAALILAVLYFKGKITVSRKVVNILIAVSLVMTAILLAIPLLTDIGATLNTVYVVTTVCFCCLAHSFHRMKK